jgi:hypothetical protein
MKRGDLVVFIIKAKDNIDIYWSIIDKTVLRETEIWKGDGPRHPFTFVLKNKPLRLLGVSKKISYKDYHLQQAGMIMTIV